MEGTSNASPITTTDRCLIFSINNRIQYLQKQEAEYRLQLEKSLFLGKSLSKEEQEATLRSITISVDELKRLLTLIGASFPGQLSSNPHVHAVCCCPFQQVQIMNQNTRNDIVEPQDKDRYLCVSNGFSICCLDLKQSKDERNDYCSSIWKVPSKISTLILPMDGLPHSLGLFRSVSYAYMVGGQESSGFKNSELKVLRTLNRDFSVKGCSTIKTYHLSLVDGSLCLSQCDNIRLLSKPRFRPIVEKIGEQIHVIETLSPAALDHFKIPSHEAFDLNDPIRGWIELSPMLLSRDKERSMQIPCHIVVGHRIYVCDPIYGREFAIFDSRENKWELRGYPCDPPDGRRKRLTNIRHVVELARLGFGSCIGEYPYGDSRFKYGDLRFSLHVVLAIGRNKMGGMSSVAYLVTEEGQILCFQRLTRFFEGFPEFEGYPEFDGTVISGGEQGKTNCVIVRGPDKVSLYITTFTWEEVEDAAKVVAGVALKKRSKNVATDRLPSVEEEDFINVVVKGWYVSEGGTDLHPYETMLERSTDLSACFL